MGVSINEKKFVEEVSDVNNIGLYKCLIIVWIIDVVFLSGLYLLENLDKMWMVFIIVIGMRKMVIMEDIICMVNFMLIKFFMVMIIVVIVMIIGVIINGILWKNINSNRNIIKFVVGVVIFICINIFLLNWFLVIGKFVMC